MTTRPCPYCGSTDIVNTRFPRPANFNGRTLNYVRCKGCDLVFTGEQLTADDLAKMYGEDYMEMTCEPEPLFDKFWNAKLKSFKGAKLLDYGCGNGNYARYFRKKGYDVTGVEYSSGRVAALKKQIPDINFLTVEEFGSTTDQYDVLFLADVLEHLNAPFQFLRKTKERIKANGLLACQGPVEHNSSLAHTTRKIISALHGTGVTENAPYHITFSNARNQRAIFERAGFSTLSFELTETNWPYPKRWDGSPAKKIMYAAASLSKSVSSIVPGMGNRFFYIGKKENSI